MVLSVYAFLATTILGMNVIPAFMPPTWMVLAFFVRKYDLQILPAVLTGAVCATLGRIILAEISRRYFRRFFSRDTQENYASVGGYLNRHKHITIPLVIAYAFLPIPSNHVFIAAGLSQIRITLLAGSFFAGRLISYTFWVAATQRISDNLIDIFGRYFSKTDAIIMQILGLVFIYLLGKIAWKKILKK